MIVAKKEENNAVCDETRLKEQPGDLTAQQSQQSSNSGNTSTSIVTNCRLSFYIIAILACFVSITANISNNKFQICPTSET